MSHLDQVLEVPPVPAEGTVVLAPVPTLLPRTFGGQVMAQAVIAGAKTLTAGYRVHTWTTSFLKPGLPALDTTLQVESLQDGRSFATRQIRSVQDGQLRAITTLSAHREGDTGPQHEAVMPDVPRPEELVSDSAKERPSAWRDLLHREWHDWDYRRVNTTTPTSPIPTQSIWIRYSGEVSADPLWRMGSLAFLADMILLGVTKLRQPKIFTQDASLNHTTWVSRLPNIGEWLLYDQESPLAGNGRGLGIGRLFTRDGELIAVFAQEGLIRTITGITQEQAEAAYLKQLEKLQ